MAGSTSILHDLPAEHDALDFKPYVAALAGIISSPTTCTPLTVGVFGEWGSGKTSLMRMVRNKLPKKFCVAWFDAWKYEREETLWRAFLLQVLRVLRDAVPKDDSKESKKAVSDLTDLEVALYRSVDRDEAGGVQIDWGKLGAGVGHGAVQIGLSFIPGAGMLLELLKEFKGKLTEDAAKNVVEAIRRERSKIHVEQVQSLEQFQGRFLSLRGQVLDLASTMRWYISGDVIRQLRDGIWLLRSNPGTPKRLSPIPVCRPPARARAGVG